MKFLFWFVLITLLAKQDDNIFFIIWNITDNILKTARGFGDGFVVQAPWGDDVWFF